MKSKNTIKYKYEQKLIQYKDDENDTFIYYQLIHEKIEQKQHKAAIITMVLGGSPYSAVIRRIVAKLYQLDYDIFIYPNRGSDLILNPKIKCDPRRMILGRDINELIKNLCSYNYNDFTLVGYSLGSFLIDDFMIKPEFKYQKYVTQIIYSWVELQPLKQQHMNIKMRKMIGSGWKNFVIKNKDYLLAHNISEEQISKAIKGGCVEDFYGNIIVPKYNYKSLAEWYEDNNVGKHLSQYKTPVLFILCNDDYVCKKFTQLQRTYLQSNKEFVDYAIFNYGQHIGGVLNDGFDIVCNLFERYISQ